MSDTTYTKMMTKGLASSLENTSVEDGKVRFTTDTNQLFIDADGERHEISDVIKKYTESEIKSLLAPLPKLYLSSDTHKLFVYASGEWIAVGKNDWIGTKAEYEEAVANGEILEGMTVYITDDYTGDGADLSIYATNDYVDGTFIKTENVVDNLTSTDSSNPLSANQGKVLNDNIEEVNANVVQNTNNIDLLDKRTSESYTTDTGNNVLYEASSYFGLDTSNKLYYLVRCTDGDGNSLLSAHAYSHNSGHSYFNISSNGISIIAVNNLGTIAYSSKQSISVSPISKEMYYEMSATQTKIDTINSDLSGNYAKRLRYTGVTVNLSSVPNGVFVVVITNLTSSSNAGAIGILQKSNSSTAYIQLLSKSDGSSDWNVSVSGVSATLSGTSCVNSKLVWSLVQVCSTVV